MNSIEKQSKAYELLFLIENYLRVSMHCLMFHRKGIDYFNLTNFPPFSIKYISGENRIDIINESKIKIDKEPGIKLNIRHKYPNLQYLDYIILIGILEEFWDLFFDELFKKPKLLKSNLLVKLKDLSTVRNTIAHNRYINKIDLGDLNSVYSLLKVNINPQYLKSFDVIVFNTYEEKIDQLLVILDKINSLLIEKSIISKQILREFQDIFSIITENNNIDDIKIDELKSLIVKYNKLPRKPGCGQKISTFIDQNSVYDLINNYRRKLERIIV